MSEGSAWPRRPQPRVRSQRVGLARHDDGERTTAYRAREALACACCTGVIDAGEIFSRHALAQARGGTRGVTTLPICGRCPTTPWRRWMSRDSVVRWIERSPYLHEARATLPDGQDVYLGYIAMTPGAAVWRGYVGHDFEPVGLGLPSVLRKAVEQRAFEATRGSVVGDAGREAAHHAS